MLLHTMTSCCKEIILGEYYSFVNVPKLSLSQFYKVEYMGRARLFVFCDEVSDFFERKRWKTKRC